MPPPFGAGSAAQKVRMGEDAWNGLDPQRVALADTPHSFWRSRSEFLRGRDQIIAFLGRKWAAELEYRLIKALGLYGQPDCRGFRIRMAFQRGTLVSIPTATRTGSSAPRA